jgi:hypothetical protein
MRVLKLTSTIYVDADDNPFFPFSTKIAGAMHDAMSAVAKDYDLREVPPSRRGPFATQEWSVEEVPDPAPQASEIRGALRDRYGKGGG